MQNYYVNNSWSKSVDSTKDSPHANRPKFSAERHIRINTATERTGESYLTQDLQIWDKTKT
jgi:hypothetical protein